MKFSYTLIKKLVPAVKSKKELIDKLNIHSFEVEDAGGDVFEVSVPPNRFSDAASHWGIATEISAILGENFRIKNLEFRIDPSGICRGQKKNLGNEKPIFKVEIKDKNLCSRYSARYFENIKIKPSPKWMQKILIDCGLRPINNVVDIMNYATLETGQPLHAFDYDKLTTNDQRQTTIIIRRAKKGEKITTLDNQVFELNENILVIVNDSPRESAVLAIAGIKGGEKAEVDKNTKRIVVEAANFDGVNIYKSSKALKLFTDASSRFSHNLSPELVSLGLSRSGELLKEIIGAKAGQTTDVNFTKPIKKTIKFDLEKFNKFIGLDLDVKTCRKYFERLGFKITQNSKLKTQNSFLVEIPPLRQDIETFEDLAEEAARLYGYNKIESAPPRIHLIPSGFEDQIILKDKIRKILIGMGISEVYNYSFIDKADENAVELENPISAQFKYLRSSLAHHLLENIKNNSRFFDEIKIFEIGKVFNKTEEKLMLGIAMVSKNKKSETRLPDGQVFFEVKGVVERLFKKIGLVDFLMKESKGESIEIESGDKIIGSINHSDYKGLPADRHGALAEINLDYLLELIVEEHEYRPLPKYPSIMRDISILVEPTARVGGIIQTIQEADLKRIDDVDLTDEYGINGKRSLTFRIIFQAEDRTLTDDEINKEMEKISKILKIKFKAIIR